FVLELRGKGTALLGHRTPLCGEHSRLNGCPGLVDHYKSTTEQDLREARGKAEGYIIGLMECGHLPPDGERDYVILSSIHRREDFLRTLLATLN
ncbi:hypothetical protein ABE528_02765, partial [Pseudomonas sp. TWI628]